MGTGGPYTACALLARYGYGEGLETAVMRLYGPRNDKPPKGGLTGRGVALTLEVQVKREGILTGCSSRVN